MNKEVHYEGWLIKSPPTKRIWRARWRRRWFTLKQGEIPEQFCLEYYTDRNCRKLKGVIDLDQCEQVDCGLRLENRKQKFQYMFDIKTPKRTYYLAADTAQDMRDWVNCICQVCHLHDTKQSLEPQDENSAPLNASNATNSTATTSLSLSSGLGASGCGSAVGQSWQSFSSEILRRRNDALSSSKSVVDHQPQAQQQQQQQPQQRITYRSNSDSVYVNADYTNRETLLCDMRFDGQQMVAAAASANSPAPTAHCSTPSSPSAASAIYLNSPVLASQSETARLAVNANGVVRKIPENLVLNNTPLPDTLSHSVQPSPALSTASGPYIPISECFSGSPKYSLDGNNPTTPLNNLDPKFYDTPRSHNNIGLNLTNDQSYSPKITNCSLQQMATTKSRTAGGHRSDSDSESVFTDDDEWTHPLPLRENVDRSTRPSDSSVENESFVLTYSQRFSKMPDDAAGKEHQPHPQQREDSDSTTPDPLAKLAKVLKNKNNLILDFKETEKTPRDLPQLSDTENTSPAIGPRDSTSVVEESYDIPRSHQLPYYNMSQLLEKVTSPEANPIATSTPNLLASNESNAGSLSHVRTLPRKHCYTNAAPSKVEGNVFRYDFIEQGDLPPVNRKLKPKVNVEDKPPEEVPAKPPGAACTANANAAKSTTGSQQNSPQLIDVLASKLTSTNLQSPSATSGAGASAFGGHSSPLKPPSVDRKSKPNAYKLGNSSTLGQVSRRSTGAPLSMVLPVDCNNYVLETRTLPRQPRTNYAMATAATGVAAGQPGSNGFGVNSCFQAQHQRTASAAAAVQQTGAITPAQAHAPSTEAEHKLQYFDLDVANPPVIARQSMSVGNLYTQGTSRPGLSADPSVRAPVQSGVVYNSVDFVKTEAFKRIREERIKESESVNAK